MGSAARRALCHSNSCRAFGMCGIVAVWSWTLPLAIFGSTLTGVVGPVPDLDVPLPSSATTLDSTYSSLALPLDSGIVDLRARDLEVLDLILRKDIKDSAMPRVGAFGRISGVEDPTRGTLGVGGIDIDWRPSSTLSVAVVAGGQIDASDAFRPPMTEVGVDWPHGHRTTLDDARATGESQRRLRRAGIRWRERGSEANPFAGDRLFSTPSGADWPRTQFHRDPGGPAALGGIVHSASWRPAAAASKWRPRRCWDATSTRSIGGQRVQAWVQHCDG